MWDAVGIGMIGILLVLIAVVLALETKSVLLGESASKDDRDKIHHAIEDGGTRVMHLKTLHLGPEELPVAAKFSVGAADAGRDIAAAIDGAEERIRAAVPIARVIYLEPDLRRTDATDVAPSEAAAGNTAERNAKARHRAPAARTFMLCQPSGR
ncbi:hypothetical protein GCM10027038_19480 [Arthrobacter bambusae]|uniref:Divalent metal cation (Fe/Co/Zn/Cd) transporter n=1 Tax=Arthrobacter bambusae TaxID=1338426 RepID=A0AAW8DCU9_9MICC|nr:divalent metal cation (Fe/Co/Zn/Cd) transporter [Arthrobacter bambusae]MDQ0127393.1 divalent metal cation (Fe/Co/Zn/Cd) transporter [Arthrobacter bambusae]MDQ0178735.1 divalent metal cation (Fe/Co/Zn/Cd) transporter [Arthrobacter bambusae]